MHQIKIVKKDGTEALYDLTASARVAFESHYQQGWRKRLVEQQMERDLWHLAYFLVKAKGQTNLEFGDEFIDQFDDIDIILDGKNG